MEHSDTLSLMQLVGFDQAFIFAYSEQDPRRYPLNHFYFLINVSIRIATVSLYLLVDT